jgi:hypothetical protein
MPSTTWQVKLYEVFEDQRPNEKPRELSPFGVQGANAEKAKAAARKWLTDKKHTIRSLSVMAPVTARQLVAIVMVKR